MFQAHIFVYGPPLVEDIRWWVLSEYSGCESEGIKGCLLEDIKNIAEGG